MELYEVEKLAKELNLEVKDTAILYRTYVEDMRNLVYKLQDAAFNSDLYMLKRACSLIKSASYNMKILVVYRASVELLKAINDRDFESIEVNSNLVCKALIDTEEQLKEIFVLKGIKL